ncbi:thiolase family protein [Gemmatimonas aurantiaca]|nr:thiolase family protein [Gemmatimonas aurantiaca]
MNDTHQIVLAGSARTPIGKFCGSFRELTAADLGVISAEASIQSAGISPQEIDFTWLGCGRQAGSGPNVARQIAYRVGVPNTSPATTVNMACASSLDALISAARAIKLGEIEVSLVGGTESMSRVPYMIFDARWGIPFGQSKLVDSMYHDGFHCKLCDMLMGATADKLAKQKNISRQAQDEYALMSQQRAEKAQRAGLFTDEIVPVTIKSRKGEKTFDSDEHPRHGSTLAGLAKLKPVFASDGTVTAGNACGITDGASTMIALSKAKATELGVTPEAELIGYSQSGVEPDIMGLGPVPAIKSLLKQTGMTLGDVDLIELNEAFAGQVLACNSELGIDLDKLNVNGGAIALGHPIGATGARIITTLLSALQQRDKEIGLAALCVSGGQGTAILVKRLS